MNNTELLKDARNSLLKLHKSLLDHERRMYETVHGQQSSGAFLNLLLEDREFSWLRRFSTLIVEIDEMFDLDDGFSDDEVEAYVKKLRDLISMEDEDEDFKAKYNVALQADIEAAALQGSLHELLKS